MIRCIDYYTVHCKQVGEAGHVGQQEELQWIEEESFQCLCI